MSEPIRDQLKLIDVRRPLMRALLIVPVVVALFFSWYATRWYVGDFVAEFAPRMDEEQQLDAAEAALRLAPDDPLAHWAVADIKKRGLLPGELADAVRHYEEAVRLSPNDYRLWMDLGRAREAAGDAPSGERALRRAVELAPSYASPRWHLGNLLLRAGRGEDAFAELRRAVDADPKLRPQLFNVAWTLYGQDVAAIRGVIGDAPAARAEFAAYLMERQRVDDALAVWAGLSPAEKKASRDAGGIILKGLLDQKRYRAALGVMSDIGDAAARPHAPAQFANGGFEENIGVSSGVFFDWQIKSDPQAQIAIDASTAHAGARSLRITFRALETLAFSNITQLVVVEPSAQYRFECYARTEDLKSAGTLLVEVVDASDGATVLGSSRPLAAGTNDWQPVTVDFKTPPKTEAVLVRVVRAPCGADAVCPIFGTVWYDDFNLQSLGGANPQPSGGRSGGRPRA